MKLDDNAMIQEYLLGKGNLSDKQKEKLNNCIKCAELIRQYGSRQKVVPMLQNMVKIGEKMISQREAYLLFDDTQHIFNVSQKDRRDFHLDILLGDIKETRQKAIAAKDFKTAAACDKNYKDLIADFYGTEETPDYSKIQPVPIFLGMYPELLKTIIPEDLEKKVRELMTVKKRALESGYDEAQILNDDAD